MAVFSAIAAGITALGSLALGAATAAGAAIGTGALGGALLIGGTAASAYGTYAQYSASQRMASAQRRAEALRKRQMQLELNNTYLTKIREAQSARARNLVAGTSQLGSGAPFGSAIANSTGSVESALGYQIDTAGQAGSIGFGIFNANAAYSDASTAKSIASGISSLGQATLGNLGAIERVGTYSLGRLTGNDYTGSLST